MFFTNEKFVVIEDEKRNYTSSRAFTSEGAPGAGGGSGSVKEDDSTAATFKLNTNLLYINVDELLCKNEPLETYYLRSGESEWKCLKCGLYHNYLSVVNRRNKSWQCENCNESNRLLDPIKAIDKHDIEYRKGSKKDGSPDGKTNPRATKSENRLFVICIDISGSMNQPPIVESSVPSSRSTDSSSSSPESSASADGGKTRLQIVQEKCIAALKKMRASEPKCRVLLMTFRDQGFLYVFQRDQTTKEFKLIETPVSSKITRDAFMSGHYDQKQFVSELRAIPPLYKSYSHIVSIIEQLEAKNGTTISNVLAYATLLASVRPKNGTVIVFTDGETEENIIKERRAKSLEFFEKLGDYASRHSTKIFILRLGECNLRRYEKFCQKSGGKIQDLDNSSNFDWIVEKPAENETQTEQPFNQLIVMSNESIVSLKSLYEGQILNEHLESNKICFKNLNERRPREIFIEISFLRRYLGARFWNQNKRCCFFQFQFTSPNATRVITTAVECTRISSESAGLLAKSGRLNAYQENQEIANMNAWRYLGYYLLDKKSDHSAKEFYDANLGYFKPEVIAETSPELDASLGKTIETLDKRRSEPVQVDKNCSKFLGGVMNRAFVNSSIYLRPKILPWRSRPQWIPSGPYSSSGCPGRKGAASSLSFPDQANSYYSSGSLPLKNAMSASEMRIFNDSSPFVSREDKIIIQTSINLPPINKPTTKVYRQTQNQTYELTTNENFRSMKDLNLNIHSVNLKDPVRFRSDLILY